MNLGKHFTLEEMTRSQAAARRGLDNSPNNKQLDSMKALVRNVLDPLREALGRPVNINSGFRSEAVNKAVGGAPRLHACRHFALGIWLGVSPLRTSVTRRQ